MGRFLRALFSAGRRASETPRAEATVEYKGYTINATPEKGPAGWRISGTIARETSRGRRIHRLDRADASPNREAIVAMTIEKAKRIIDEQGDRIFGDA